MAALQRRRVVWAVLAGTVLATGPDRPATDEVVGAGGLRLVLNLPAYRLDVFEGDELRKSYTVAVGRPGNRTPRGSYEISKVVWNPWWHPPNSPWARGASPTPPGPRNPMGRVKLYFRDLYYIHGTPAEQSLGSPASAGCVRMRNEEVMDLARLVHSRASPGVSVGELERLARNPSRTRMIRLDQPVPLEVVYQRAEIRSGQLVIHPDVYGVAQRVIREEVLQELLRKGYDLADLDRDRLEALVQRGRSERVSVPVESLLVSESLGVPASER